MSDALGTNPMKVDTASATAKALPGGTNQKLCINKIVWENPTTDGHNCTIQDAAGNQLVKFDPAIATYNQSFEFNDMWVTGLIVPILDSGNLYIYLR